MFQKTSMTGTGAVVTLLNAIFLLFGFELPEGSVESAVQGVVAIVGFVLLAWGQIRRTDLIAGLFRKEPRV